MQGRAARQEARREAGAEGVRQHDAGRADPADGRAELRARARHASLLWVQQHRERRVPHGQDRARSTTWWPAAGSRRRTSRARGRSPRRSCPTDFKKIPLEHPRSRVLASVPGTQQAAEAVLLAQVPQTARVNKKELKAPEVAYQGDPKFEPIEKTTRRSARSTPTRTSSRSATCTTCASRACGSCRRAPTGPWEVAELGPEADLRDPGQLAGPQRHLRHRARTTTTSG